MVKALLTRGMLAGALAGLLAAGFAWLFGEPQLALALRFESHLHGMAGGAPEPELVSRTIQSTLGLLTGIVVYSCALGGIFALVFAYGYGRIGRLGPRATTALLAAVGFAALILTPQLKYPASPPAVGEAATIGLRTALYFAMIAVSVLSAVAAWSTASRLARRFGARNAILAAAGAYGVAMLAASLALPPVDEVPAGFPLATLWRFRLASLGTEAVLWTTLGLAFAYLAERLLRPTGPGPAARRGRAALRSS